MQLLSLHIGCSWTHAAPQLRRPLTGNPPLETRREEVNDVDEERGQQDAWDGCRAEGHRR